MYVTRICICNEPRYYRYINKMNIEKNSDYGNLEMFTSILPKYEIIFKFRA